MEATRLAPAGRACSKFVWQCRFLKTGRFECLGIRAALSLRKSLIHATCGPRIAAGIGLSPRLWRFDTQLSISAHLKRGRISGSDLIRPPGCDRACPFFAGHWARFLGRSQATLLPRLGVTPRGRNAADGGRLTANHGSAPRRRTVGRLLVRLGPGSEFVSEFETKQDQ
jgi:hypothetical protein